MATALQTSPDLLTGLDVLTDDGTETANIPPLLTGADVQTDTTLLSSQGDKPVISVEVAFDADNTQSGWVWDGSRWSLQPLQWLSVSEYVRGVSTRRGRQAELNQFEAGGAQIILDDRTGVFNPANASAALPSRGWPTAPDGSAWPYTIGSFITPMRRVRVTADWNGTRYPIFQGFAESWAPSYAQAGKDEIITLSCVDAFKPLRYATVGAPGSGQVTMTSQNPGNRIQSILSYASGIAYRYASVGVEVLRQVTFSGTELVQAIQDAATAGLGVVYCDTDGAVRFDHRTYRQEYENTSRATFGEDLASGEVPITDIVYAYDDTLVYTEVTVTPSGRTDGLQDPPQTVSDATAIRRYGRRVYQLSIPIQKSIGGVAPATDPDTTTALAYANVLLARYKDPGLRVQSLTLIPGANPSVSWPAALGIPLGGLVRVKRRSVWNTANPVDRFSYVESVAHDITPAAWTTRFEMSPSDIQATWLLGVAGFSELGFTTRLGG